MGGNAATVITTTAIAKAGRLLRYNPMATTTSLKERVKPCLRKSVQARRTAVQGGHKRRLVSSIPVRGGNILNWKWYGSPSQGTAHGKHYAAKGNTNCNVF